MLGNPSFLFLSLNLVRLTLSVPSLSVTRL